MNVAGATSTTRKISLSSQSETAKLPQTTPDAPSANNSPPGQPLIRTRAKTPPRGLPPNEMDVSRRPPLSKEDNTEGG